MADFSLVKSQDGEIRGIWLANPENADQIGYLTALALRIGNEEGSQAPFEAVLAKDYRVVPNTYDEAGGCFVMFGSTLAPGEEAG